jgi:predicted dehydrogenase
MKTLGVGVLGFGFMGRMHTLAHRAIPFYYDPVPVACRLTAVCERTDELAQAARAAGEFQRCTTDPLQVIRADDVDLVHVCTPNPAHYPALVEAIRAGKHVYVDKPVTASLDEAEQVARLLPSYRGRGQVALQYRFVPATMKAKRLIQEGFVGALAHFRGAFFHSGSVDPLRPVNWKSTAAAGGGVIRDLGAHVVDLLWHLIGPFHRACCVSRIWSAERPSLDEPGQRIRVDAEDAALILLRSGDGAFGSVEVSKIATGAEDELRLEIRGRCGAIRFDSMQPNYLEVYDGRPADGDLGGRGWQRIACVHRYPAPGGRFPGPKFPLGWVRAHVHCLYSFLKSVAEGGTPSPSLEEGIHLQRVLEAMRESARSQQWVDLPQQVAPG